MIVFQVIFPGGDGFSDYIKEAHIVLYMYSQVIVEPVSSMTATFSYLYRCVTVRMSTLGFMIVIILIDKRNNTIIANKIYI